MKKSLPITCSIAAGMILLFTAGSARGLPKLSDKIKKRLEAGNLVKIPIRGDALGGKSFILLDDSPDTCYRAVVDLDNYYYFYDDTLISAKLLKKEKNKQTVKMVYGKGPVTMTYHARYTLNSKKSFVKFNLDDDYENDLVRAFGYIRFMPYNEEKTLMINATVIEFEEKLVWKVFGKKITNGMLKLPKYLRRFLTTPKSKKYRVAAN
jgi:hypothetical protein